MVLEKAKRNELNHFEVDMSKFKDTTKFVVSIIKVCQSQLMFRVTQLDVSNPVPSWYSVTSLPIMGVSLPTAVGSISTWVAETVLVFRLMTETEQPVDGPTTPVPAQGRLGLPPLTT